jgi:hypothetical protein
MASATFVALIGLPARTIFKSLLILGLKIGCVVTGGSEVGGAMVPFCSKKMRRWLHLEEEMREEPAAG